MSMLKTTILALNLDAAPIGWNGSQRMLPKKGKVKEIANEILNMFEECMADCQILKVGKCGWDLFQLQVS